MFASSFVMENNIRGSGIPKLYKDAKSYGLNKSELMEIGNTFRVNLFRKAFETDEFGVINPENVVEKREFIEKEVIRMVSR